METKKQITARMNKHLNLVIKYFYEAEKERPEADNYEKQYFRKSFTEKGHEHMNIAYELCRILDKPIGEAEDFINDELRKLEGVEE